jgi:hypothetical protein
MHIVPERLGPWPLWAKAAPLSIITPIETQVTHVVPGMCALIPSVILTVHQGLGASARMAQLEMGQDLCR